MSILTVDLRLGETLTIGGARVTLQKKSGQLARLEIEADEGTAIQAPRRKAPETDKEPACQP
jgi:hypothetical protein